MFRSRLPPEGRYGTSYLAPDFVSALYRELVILSALLHGLLTAPHSEFFFSA